MTTRRGAHPLNIVEVRAYLAHVRVEQRRAGVTGQQARPMLAPQVRIQFVRHAAGRRSSPNCQGAGREEGDVVLFVTAFHAVQRDLGLSHALAAQILSVRYTTYPLSSQSTTLADQSASAD